MRRVVVVLVREPTKRLSHLSRWSRLSRLKRETPGDSDVTLRYDTRPASSVTSTSSVTSHPDVISHEPLNDVMGETSQRTNPYLTTALAASANASVIYDEVIGPKKRKELRDSEIIREVTGKALGGVAIKKQGDDDGRSFDGATVETIIDANVDLAKGEFVYENVNNSPFKQVKISSRDRIGDETLNENGDEIVIIENDQYTSLEDIQSTQGERGNNDE